MTQRQGLQIQGSAPNPMVVQRVKLEMSFGQVFALCFKVVLAQMLLVPILAIVGALGFVVATWIVAILAG